MTLNEWAAQKKLAILETLAAHHPPQEGDYDEAALKEAFAKGKPQVGATRYEPSKVRLEFIFPDPASTATVLTVSLTPPERIVFLPIPDWVIEDVWQGGIEGSHHFESDARALLSRFAAELEPEANAKWFGPRQPRRRE